MLTEDDLHELIESAASAAPEPEPLPDDLFHVDAPRSRRRSYRAVVAPLAAVAGVLVVVLVAGSWLTTRDDPGKSLNTAAPVSKSIGPSAAEAPATTFLSPDAQGGAGAGGTAAGAGTVGDVSTPLAATSGGGAAPPSPQIAPPADSARIIKTGALEVKVAKGAVTESVNRLTALATGLGGYVSETRTTASAESGAQATAAISLRVPAGAFEQLMSEASKLGEVRSTTTSGQDVTAQFTDVEAQLGALKATRDQLLTVLGQAKNIGDILAVQDRITQVQVQIDQLEGQKRLLSDQTTFGTVSVTLLEPGATVAVPPIDDNKDLGDAWRDARRNFGDAIENIVGTSGTIAVVLLCGAIGLGATWLIYRRVRRQII